jgi:hypothetical protein
MIGAKEREEFADIGERSTAAGADVLDESARLLGACLGFRFGSGRDLDYERLHLPSPNRHSAAKPRLRRR